MKRFRSLLFCLLYFSNVFIYRVDAQIITSSSARCNIYAQIVSISSAGEKTPLNFGLIHPGPQGGKIILSPENTISVQGSGFKGSGTHNAASFYMSGNDGASYSITLPTTPVVLTHASKSYTMYVDGWVSSLSPATGAGMLQLGIQVVNVGATLKVGNLNDNPLGIYTGSYAITFDFN
jgi:hypothetical protein